MQVLEFRFKYLDFSLRTFARFIELGCAPSLCRASVLSLTQSLLRVPTRSENSPTNFQEGSASTSALPAR